LADWVGRLYALMLHMLQHISAFQTFQFQRSTDAPDLDRF
jgi:hypothetical protein